MARPQFHNARRKPVQLPSIYRHSSAAETMLQLTPHEHLDKLLAGAGDREAWKTIKYRINEASILAVRHFPEREDVREALAGAVRALCDIGQRYAAIARYGCSGDEFRALGLGLTWADELQIATTRRQQLAASVLMHTAPRRAVGTR